MSTVTEKVADTYKAAVRTAVAKGNHSRWGNEESVSVIEALFGLALSDEEVGLEGFDAISQQVSNVVNPSAFAQILEGLPDGTGQDKEGKPDKDVDGNPKAAHPAWIRRGKRGGGGSRTAGL